MKKTDLEPKLVSIVFVAVLLCAILAGVVSAENAVAKSDAVNGTLYGNASTAISNSCLNSTAPKSSANNSLSSEIDRFLNVNKPVFLFLYADWCHFCQQQKPIIDELEQEYADKITFIHVNAKENPQAIYEFGVTGFPAMFLIVDKNKEGFVYQEFYGFTEKEVLKESFDYGWEWGLSESIEESSIQSDQTESGTLSITSQENSSVRRWVPYYEMWMTCYSTRKEAADAAKAKYVKPSWCFVRECCPDEDHPWVTIPGTGCAHWVAHQKNISRHPTCYAGRSLCVEDVCPENQRHDWKCCRKGDIWVTPDGGHCGIVTHVNKDTTGKVISLNIEHCSRKCGEKAVCLKPEQVDYGNCCAMRKLCEDKSARKICRGDTVVTQEYDVCEWVDKSETDCSDGYKCVENRIDECKSTAECKKTDDGNGDGDGDGPWPDPDNDRPDENYDVSTPKITSNITFNPETIPQVAVLFKGFPLSTQKLLADFNEPTVFVAAGFSPYLVNDYPILIIPSGGLYGLDSLLSFKSNLEEYVKNGGTLIVFSQQHGYEYSALPGGNLSGFGWLEDQSCHHGSVYIDTYHPILSGQDSVTSDVTVDGYLTKYPENTTILLSRTKNGMPVMLMYEYGNGTVIASTIYTDWGYDHYQATQDGKNLVRDMIAWAKDRTEISEYGRSDTVNASVNVTNVHLPMPEVEYPQYELGDTVDISINVTNYANITSDKVSVSVFDPDYEIDYVNVSVSIPANESKIVNLTYPTTNESKRGTYFVLYSLHAGETVIGGGFGGGFALGVNTTNLSTYKLNFTLTDPDKEIVKQENISVYVPPGEIKAVNFTYANPSKLGIWILEYDILDYNNTFIDSGTEKFAVSKYAENPEGFVYQGKKITFAVTSPEEHYPYGSEVPFTIHIWNKGDADRNISFSTYYEDWSLRDVLSEQNVEGNLIVPAGEEATYTHILPVGDIRLSHNQLIIRAEFYEDGSNLGRTEKVVWMFSPSVSVHVETEQEEYAKGEAVSVLLNLTNKRSASCNATVNVRTLDLDNNKVFEDTFNVNLSAYESLDKTLSFTLPTTAEYGTYIVTAEAVANDDKIGSGSSYFKVLKDYIVKVSFDKSDTAYKIRENMSIDLEVTNIGSALWSSIINISIPDLAYENSSYVSLNPKETEKICYDLNIPENVTAGKHDVIVTIGFDSSVKQYFFVIPQSNLVLSSDKTSYNAGEYIYFNLTNIGGVDTTCNCSIKFYGPSAIIIHENETSQIMLAGETKTLSFKITDHVVSGRYYLIASCRDLNTDKITRMSKSYDIRGLKASLSSNTDKKTYSRDENVSILTNITNLDGAIVNGTLNLKIVSPFIPTSTSKMAYSNVDINRTARILDISEGEDIDINNDIDNDYRGSMMREPHPHQMSQTINESENMSSNLPEPYYIPFDPELKREEEFNLSSQPQLYTGIEKFSSESMVIGNETVWQDETIIVKENITINSTGTLTLINTTLIMNCSSDGEYRIEVRNGGEMHIRDKSNITALNPNYGFCFQVHSGSTFEMRDSELHKCGYRSSHECEGLWINTNDTIIENNSITNNRYGIILYQSGNNSITGNNVSSNFYHGIYLYDSSNNSITGNNACSNYHGIYLYDSSNNSITGNNASSNSRGICLYYSSNNSITGNNACSNYHGICLYYSSNNSITGNNASSNFSAGILLGDSSNNTLTGNNACSNYDGIYLYDSSSNILTQNIMNGNRLYNFAIFGDQDAHYNHSIDTSNTVDEKPIYYVKGEKDRTFDGSTNAGFFAAVFCDNITVKDLELSNNRDGLLFWKTNDSLIWNVTTRSNGIGIHLRYSSNNSITGNNASSNSYCGIYLYDSSNNNITGNNASSNSYGIYLYDSSNNNIIGNNATSNYFNHGIHLRYSSNNSITGNNASSNFYDGIHLYYSSNNNITGNNACSNSWSGIHLHYSSNNNITGNNACSNSRGICLYDSSNNNITGNNASSNSDYGIYLYDSSNINLIYNNDFNNTKNAYDDGNNIWNITKTPGTNIVGGSWLGGNYWSDYNGTDEDGDGLGDTLLPYDCSGNITHGGDYLPLIKVELPKYKTIWETNITVNMAEDDTKNIVTDVPIAVLKDVTGKLELIATLYNHINSSQVINQSDRHSFFITDKNTSLTLETDKPVYKPNETVTIYGEVGNNAVLTDDYNLSINKDGVEIFSDSFTLDPGESYNFTTDTTSETSFTLEGAVDGVTVTDFVNVEQASINVSIIAPDVVGLADFDVGVLIENIGKIYADLNVSINSTWNITVPEGESRLLETTKRITENTTLNVIISGDVNETIQKEMVFGENARINITPQPTYLEGTVEIPYTITNIGLFDTEFNATFSIDSQTVAQKLFVPKDGNITGSVTFNLTRGAHLLKYGSPFEMVNETINVLSPPEFSVTYIYPTDMNFTIGENVTLVFKVKNIGGTEGEATLTLEMPDYEETNRTWIIAGEEGNISFNLTIPYDLEEKSYKGFYELDGTRDEFTFFVQGANISVDASLDKSMYAEGDTAVLTLELTNECALDLDLYSRVKFNDYDNVQNFTLSCSGTETLIFYAPANFTGDNKILYTVYMDSGRALYINSIYIYEEQPDTPIRLFTDKDVYNMGDVVTIHIVDVTGTDVLNLTAPNFYYNDTISGPRTLEFTLPELRSGTYYIEYTFGNFSSTHPFDVRGYSARVLEACLDKEIYRNRDMMKLKMNMEANRNVSGLLKTWIYDPEENLIDVFEMNKTLIAGENKIELCRTLSTSMSGIHVIVYGFSAVLSGDSSTMLVSGAEYFDADAGGLCGDVAPYPDCNGIVDMGDVILLLNNVSYPEDPRYILSNDWAGDCRCTGVRDMGDVILLLNNVSYPEDPGYVLDCC